MYIVVKVREMMVRLVSQMKFLAITIKIISLLVLVVFLVTQLVPQRALALTDFLITWDTGTYSADYSHGSNFPRTDGRWPELVSPGFGGAGYGVKNNLTLQTASTTKYEIENNFDPNIGSIHLKVKTPYAMKGDLGTNKFSNPSQLYYDPASEFIYVNDETNNRIVKTKIDGTGFTSLGSTGSGIFQFDRPYGMYYDAVSDYIYVADYNNQRIVKTKMDGTGWTTFSTITHGAPRGVFYDSASELIYFTSNTSKIVRTKIDGSSLETYGTAGVPSTPGQFAWPSSIYYDAASEYMYIVSQSNHYIIKTQWGGAGWEYLGGYGTGSLKFRTPGQIYYDAVNDYVYVSDYQNSRVVKTQMDGTGWTTYDTWTNLDGNCSGIWYDPATSYVYTSSWQGNKIAKVMINGSNLTTFGTVGYVAGAYRDTSYGILGMSFDQTNKDIYTADDSGRVVKTKIDGNSLEYLGHLDPDGTDDYGFSEDAGGIDYDPVNDYVYVADYTHQRIDKFKMNGTEWNTWGVDGFTNPGEFGAPADVDVNPATEYLYIADYTNDWIIKTKYDGTGWTTLGAGGGCVDGSFNGPSAIHYDVASEFIYVADYWCNSIVKTKIDGTGFQRFGTYGAGAGQFEYPSGIYYDAASDFVYVADFNNGRVIKTKMDGSGWTQFTTGSIENPVIGETYKPKDVAYDASTENIYIIDSENDSLVETKADQSNWSRYNADPYKKIFWTSGTNPINLVQSATEGRFIFSLAEGNSPLLKSNPLTWDEGSWHDINLSYDNTAGEVKMYVDSVLQMTATPGTWVSNSFLAGWGDYFYIGSNPSDYNQVYSGLLDQITATLVTVPEITTPPNTLIITDPIVLPESGSSQISFIFHILLSLFIVSSIFDYKYRKRRGS